MSRLFPIAMVLWAVLPLSTEATVVEPGRGNEPSAETGGELDFMVGLWDIEAKIRNGPDAYLVGSGSMDVRWEGETLVADMDIAFDDFAVIGTTTRRLDPAGDRWRVGWYPEGGQGAEPNIDGVFLDGRFIEINYGVDERGPFLGRLVVYDITRDHFRVRKDRLYDDGALAPEIWVYEATRAAAD